MDKPLKIQIAARPLHCSHCQNDTFYPRRTVLRTRGVTDLDQNWVDKSAINYICARCGRLECFVDASLNAATIDTAECLSCGTTIPAGETCCPNCGWTYEQGEGEGGQ